MPTTTSNYSLDKPLVNSATDQDLWGGYLNGDMDSIDGLLRVGITVAVQSSQTVSFDADVSISVKKLYPCDATSGVITATLPAASTAANGSTVFFKKTDSSANAVTIVAAGSDTIDGAASKSLSSQYDILALVCDGSSKWYEISVIPSIFTGDSGSGGTSGLVPAPSAGDTAADKFLKADATFAQVSKLSTASGSAPSYSARAWATINGSTGALTAGGNVASATRNSTGSYSITFTTAMTDANYAVVATGNKGSLAGALVAVQSKTTGGLTVITSTPSTQTDLTEIYIVVYA